MILALNGGGMRGALQAGALSELSAQVGEPELWKLFPGGVYGISVGAIIGAYVAFGFSAQNISDILLEWAGVPLDPPRLESLVKFRETNGLDDGRVIRERLRQDFAKRGFDFESLRIRDARIPLRIIATDCVNVRSVIFGPNVRLWDALRSSTSVPFVYKPHTFSCGTFIDGVELCPNIMSAIPMADRPNVFFLLISRSIPVKPQQFFETMASFKSLHATRKIHERYPTMTCLLTDDETATFNVWGSKESSQSTAALGARRFRHFATEGAGQEFLVRCRAGRS